MIRKKKSIAISPESFDSEKIVTFLSKTETKIVSLELSDIKNCTEYLIELRNQNKFKILNERNGYIDVIFDSLVDSSFNKLLKDILKMEPETIIISCFDIGKIYCLEIMIYENVIVLTCKNELMSVFKPIFLQSFTKNRND